MHAVLPARRLALFSALRRERIAWQYSAGDDAHAVLRSCSLITLFATQRRSLLRAEQQIAVP